MIGRYEFSFESKIENAGWHPYACMTSTSLYLSITQDSVFLPDSQEGNKKHWFVLAGASLRYYADAKAEEAGQLDGRIDLTSCYEVAEVATHRNYGFKVKVSLQLLICKGMV